jgi:exopolyphosphatase/guanosine-5'-triphosphate,3'-diphosphate pyrophosphatase
MIAIDLGSNTLRIIEYDGQNWGKSFERIVRTAQGLNKTGKISHLALARIITALEEASICIDFSSHEIVAITTAAMRIAHNSAECLQQIKSQTGISFRIIDGEEEAMLTLMAVRNRLYHLNRPTSELILVDIGGGSTEVVVVSDGRMESKSFPIGIVTLSEKARTVNALMQELEDCRDTIASYIASLMLSKVPETLVLTAGTPTTIVSYLMGMEYHTYDSTRINGAFLTRQECERVLHELLKMDESSRARFVGIGREQLIVVGIQITEMIFDAFALNHAIVIDDGLREGVALNYYFQNQIPNLT